MFINAVRHLMKILTHKFWVGIYCFKAGLYWQGIVHDLSKFSPTEFIESVRYYQGDRSPIDACKEKNGYSMAWLHHRGRNYHHYENWVDNFDNYNTEKGITLLQMPFKYALEMLCDYLGAGRAYWGSKFTFEDEWKYWLNKRKRCAMNPYTKHFIDRCLYIMRESGSSDILSNRRLLEMIYEEKSTDLN